MIVSFLPSEQKSKKGRRVLGARIPSIHAKCIHILSGHPPPISHSSIQSSKIVLAHVQATINERRDRANLSAQLLLDTLQSLSVIVGDEVHRETQVSKASRTANAMQVRFAVLREVKVDDDIHGLNINTSSE